MNASNFQGKWAVPVYLKAIRGAAPEDLPALRGARARELARLRPRKRLVAALQKRIAALDVDGMKTASDVAAAVMSRLTRGTRFAFQPTHRAVLEGELVEIVTPRKTLAGMVLVRAADGREWYCDAIDPIEVAEKGAVR